MKRAGGHYHLGLRLTPDDPEAQAAQGPDPKSVFFEHREVPGFAGRSGRQHARHLGRKNLYY